VVTAGTPIAVIVDYSAIKLDFTVPEVLLGTLKTGLPVVASAAAFPGEQFTGTIASIEPLIDPVTRAITVRALLPNRGLKLRPGMLMTVAMASRPRTALVVPELAVLGLGGESFVFRVAADGSAQKAVVATGSRRDGRVEITGGLALGDRIVTEGTVKVRDGGKVKPQDAATGRRAAA
jgi:membrane fusion protein, multidrug efflux system